MHEFFLPTQAKQGVCHPHSQGRAKLLAYAEGRIDLPPPVPTHLLIDA